MVSLPPQRIELAHIPTPIEPLFQIRPRLWVKRDDLTGSELSGNKVRKLEYLVADAQAQECDILVTAGDVQSNHARATALVAARVGMSALLVLDGSTGSESYDASDPEWWLGNAFIDRMVGAEIDWQPGFTNLPGRIDQACERLRSEGRRPYAIPLGGSNALGVWGYITAAQEIKAQCDVMGIAIDRVIVVSGTCGTHAGLILGARLLDWDVQVTGMGIGVPRDKMSLWATRLLQSAISDYGFDIELRAHDLELHDYSGLGYAKSRREERAVVLDVARRTGILLDPVYTGKAFYGMLDLMNRGVIGEQENVLFLHSGGLPGLLAKAGCFGLDEL